MLGTWCVSQGIDPDNDKETDTEAIVGDFAVGGPQANTEPTGIGQENFQVQEEGERQKDIAQCKDIAVGGPRPTANPLVLGAVPVAQLAKPNANVTSQCVATACGRCVVKVRRASARCNPLHFA